MRSFFLRRLSGLRSGRRGRSDRRRVIFLYHRIASPGTDPFALSVPPSWFQDQLDVLRSRYEMVSLDEILDTTRATRANLAAITFDDGYVDNLTTASPILRAAGIPATFFICTGCLGDDRGFWWDRVATAIAATRLSGTSVGPTGALPLTVDLSHPEARLSATLRMAEYLRPMHPDERDRAVDELEGALLGSGDDREPCPVLDEAGVRELGAQPLMQLGAHTHRHPVLSGLTLEQQLEEINRGAERIREITGTRPGLLAYPYGGEKDYSEESCRAARAASMAAAFVNHDARFDPDGQPYRIPRHYVPPLPADGFRAWLEEVVST